MRRGAWARRPAGAALLAALALAGGARAQLSAQFGDWELACDNTGTCRAAGYAPEDQTAASVLLTRDAGPGTATRLSWQALRSPGDAGDPLAPPVTLQVGRLQWRATSTELSPADSARVVAAMREANELLLIQGRQRSVVSLSGLKATLLKMDEAQGRLNTPGAWVRRGTRPEAQVPPARPAPSVTLRPPLTSAPPSAKLAQALWAAARRHDPDCWTDLPDEALAGAEVHRLDAEHWLLIRLCTLGAYQGSGAVWRATARGTPVVERLRLPGPPGGDGDEDQPMEPAFGADGVLHSTAKGRGIGDCFSTRRWGWTGSAFVLLEDSSSGRCRGFPGGAWDLPTWTTRVTP